MRGGRRSALVDEVAAQERDRALEREVGRGGVVGVGRDGSANQWPVRG